MQVNHPPEGLASTARDAQNRVVASIPPARAVPADLELLFRALAFAAEKHRDQRRKGAEASPYINHPIAVARMLASEGGVTDVEVLCAALLHDTLEDTETTRAELREHFGPAVAALVAEVTDDKSLPKDTRKALQIQHAPHLSPGAKLVKLADKTCNLRDILATPPQGWDLERKRAYFDWATAVVAGLRGVNPALERAFDEICAWRDSLAGPSPAAPGSA